MVTTMKMGSFLSLAGLTFLVFAMAMPFAATAQDLPVSCRVLQEQSGIRAPCDDGRFCNGLERCAPDDPAAETYTTSRFVVSGCVRSENPCENPALCDEDEDICQPACWDEDGDGFDDKLCGGNDCNDTDPLTFPGATEICDAEGRDEDCDPDTLGESDRDGDGFHDMICRKNF
ncbi:MAG: putative metal-binding motif-containing protein [Pseudomonadota bacterium]